jgi:hypothetical protein
MTPLSNDRWTAVTYGNGAFIGVDSINGGIARSVDGHNWTVVTRLCVYDSYIGGPPFNVNPIPPGAPGHSTWGAPVWWWPSSHSLICAGPGGGSNTAEFTVVATCWSTYYKPFGPPYALQPQRPWTLDGTIAYSRDNGRTWSQANGPVTRQYKYRPFRVSDEDSTPEIPQYANYYNWGGLAYGNNRFVLINRTAFYPFDGYRSVRYPAYDSEGWSTTIPPRLITVSNPPGWTQGIVEDYSQNGAAWSPDGSTTWNTVPQSVMPCSGYWNNMIFDGSQFIACGAIVTNPVFDSVSTSYLQIGRYYAGIIRSTNGVNWTHSLISNLTGNTYIGDTWNGLTRKGSLWTPNGNGTLGGIAYKPDINTHVSVALSGKSWVRSTNGGITWTSHSLGPDQAAFRGCITVGRDIIEGGTCFIAILNSNTVVRSKDGLSFTKATDMQATNGFGDYQSRVSYPGGLEQQRDQNAIESQNWILSKRGGGITFNNAAAYIKAWPGFQYWWTNNVNPTAYSGS